MNINDIDYEWLVKEMEKYRGNPYLDACRLLNTFNLGDDEINAYVIKVLDILCELSPQIKSRRRNNWEKFGWIG